MSPARGRGERVEKAQGKAGEGRWPAGLWRRVGRASGLVQVHIWAGRWCPSLLSASTFLGPFKAPVALVSLLHLPALRQWALRSPPAHRTGGGSYGPRAQPWWGGQPGSPTGQHRATEAGRRGVGWPGPLYSGHPPPEAALGHRGRRPSPRSKKRVGAHVTTRLCHVCRKWPPDREP